MYERLQKTSRSSSATSTIIRPTTLALDGNFITEITEAVKGAQVEVRMCAYAWRWYDSEPELTIQKFNNELLRAHKRGIRCRIIVDSETMCKRFTSLGFDCRSVVNTRMLHTKAICIDHSCLSIGSHNFTKRANADNYEATILTGEFEPVAQFIDYFDRLWASRG
jgi:hypothetical protein